MATTDLYSSLNEDLLRNMEPEEVTRLRVLLAEKENAELDALCSQRIASESAGPLYWLQNLTRTVDDMSVAKGTPAEMPFPRKSYFVPLMDALLDSPRLLICKTRNMVTSWTVCGYATWLCQWNPGVTAIIQTMKEEKAGELIRYVRILTELQEPWLRERHPVTRSTGLSVEWANGSRIFGIPGGPDQLRMFHPYLVVFDEAAFMEDFQACWDATSPAAYQMVAISTARASTFGDWCMDDTIIPPKKAEPPEAPRLRPKVTGEYPYPIDRSGVDFPRG